MKSQEENQKYKLIKSNRYNALTTAVSEPNGFNEVSGDNYTLRRRKQLFPVAYQMEWEWERRLIVKVQLLLIFRIFLEAKFDKAVALKTINSILMLKSNDELFATLMYLYLIYVRENCR